MLRDGRAVLSEPVEALPMDGDLYQSTMDALTNLYDKVSAVGFIIVVTIVRGLDVSRRSMNSEMNGPLLLKCRY